MSKNSPQSSTSTDRGTVIEPRVYRVREVAALLRCDPGAVYDLLHAGKMRYVRFAGGTMIVPREAVDEYLAGESPLSKTAAKPTTKTKRRPVAQKTRRAVKRK